MQQEKMGCLLRELRKEKSMTQEQMAEVFNVSNRTISRWENGISIPDISVLIEMANYFDVDILELIKGERKENKMVTDNNEKLREIASYADEQKNIIVKQVHCTDVIGFVCCIFAGLALEGYMKFDHNMWILLQLIFLGSGAAMLMKNITYESGLDAVLKRCRRKHRWLTYLYIVLLGIMLITLCSDAYMILNM